MQFVTSGTHKEGKQLLATMTGEFVQPVRVYYRIQDKAAVKRVFSKLKCIEFDRDRDRQVWLYQKEANKLKFKKPYSSIPLEYKPLVIGSFFSKKDNEMYLETRSIERAIEGIVFFDKYIKRYMAKVEDVCIINRLFSLAENTASFSRLFNKEVIIDPEKKLEKLGIMANQGKSLSSIFEEQKKEPLLEVERFPSYYYEDGIELLKLSLQSRQYVAMQHWKGNNNYTLGDYITKIVSLDAQAQENT